MNCSDWVGGLSMGPSLDSSEFVDEDDGALSTRSITPTKTVQGAIPGSESGKPAVGDGGLDLCEVIYTKDNVTVHPARYARERISGLLRLTKLGRALFLTWTPPLPFDAGVRRASTDWRTAEKDLSSYAILAVSLTEIRSIRRHTPSVGLQYIIIVLTSGFSVPPLYFHTGGVKEFFATLRNHALLVRSIDDPGIYFVNNVHVQNREKEAKETAEDQRDREPQEKDQASETKDEKAQVPNPIPAGWADTICARASPSPMCHLDTPLRKRLRRSTAQDSPDLPPPKEEIVLKFTTSLYPIRKKGKETQEKIAKEEALNKEAPFPEKVDQGVGLGSCPDMFAGNPRRSSLEYLDTPSRKRYRRSLAQALPALPPPKEEIVLEFSSSVHPSPGRNSRPNGELVVPPVPGADTSVYNRQRKTVDLVLSPVAAESSRGDVAPTSPHFTSAVEPERSPQLRTSEIIPPAGAQDGALLRSPLSGKLRDDAAPCNALEYFSVLFRSGGFREGVSLPVSWRNRLHLAELSSEECAWARRRREWWLGSCLSASVATSIPSPVLSFLFTSEFLLRLMIDSGLTHQAFHALMNMGKLGVSELVKNGDICRYLKIFFSEAIRNRLRWARVGGAVSGAAADQGTHGQRSVVQQLAIEEPLATTVILPLPRPPAVSQPNDKFEKPARRWVQKSARAALRQVFVAWGCRPITPDETAALASRFHGTPDAMQIMQLFRNWAHLKRRKDRKPGNSTSHAQPPTAGRTFWRVAEASSPTQDAQQARPQLKKPSDVYSESSLPSESQPADVREHALILAREVLLEAFQGKGYREITIDEAMALAVGFRGYPNASQIQLLFGKWAQEKRRRDKISQDTKQDAKQDATQDKEQDEEQLSNKQLISFRQALHRKRLADAARRREDTARALRENSSALNWVSGCK